LLEKATWAFDRAQTHDRFHLSCSQTTSMQAQATSNSVPCSRTFMSVIVDHPCSRTKLGKNIYRNYSAYIWMLCKDHLHEVWNSYSSLLHYNFYYTRTNISNL